MNTDSGNAIELPNHKALLVVDMEKFSDEPGRDHARLTETIREILHQTFHGCGLGELWNGAEFDGTTGDGYYLGVDSKFLPYLLDPFLLALQEELAYRNSVSRRTIRMRAAVNVGPMTGGDANTISEGSGDARIENHRLLDSEPVRDLLERSSAVTCVAAIVSARAFEEAVLSGYTGEDPELYVPTQVQVKSYRGTAYLRVPRPSGDLLGRGFHPDTEVESTSEENPAPSTASGNTATGVHGPVAQHSSRANTGIDVSGNGNQVTTVHGDQHTAPHYSGHQDHSTRQYGDHNIHISGNNEGGIRQDAGPKGKR